MLLSKIGIFQCAKNRINHVIKTETKIHCCALYKVLTMSNIKIFDNKKVRSHFDADKEIWYFSIVDIVGILTEQPTVERARNYWKVLKSRLKKEGNESVTNCNQLKLQSDDGKFYKTDVGNVEDIFRTNHFWYLPLSKS